MPGPLMLVVVVLAAALVDTASGEAIHRVGKDDLEAKIDEFVEAMLECYEIPGMNLAVVRDDQPYLSKGYGVKDLESMEPLTNKTLMVLASVTKAFVSTLLGLVLEDSEGVTWDTPVRDVLGDWFYFHESHRSSKATIKDLLAHRMGLPRHDQIRLYDYTTRELIESVSALHYYSPESCWNLTGVCKCSTRHDVWARSVFRKLRFLEFSQEWREGHLYNNLMYGLASYVTETLEEGEHSWEDLVRQKLFTPLGMTESSFVHQDEDRWPQYATGYLLDGDALRPVSLHVTKAYYSSISAPGGLSTNAEDMSKWMTMHLNSGQNSEGEQVVPASVLADTHSPASMADGDPAFGKPDDPVTWTNAKGALGWREGYYRGFKKSSHSGARDGYRALLTLLTDMGMAVFVNCNSDDGGVRDLIHMYILDLLLGEEPWLDIETACSMKPAGQNRTEQQTSDKKGVAVQYDVQDYVGVYGDYAYGNSTVFINQTTGQLSLSYGPVQWKLTETDRDVFQAQGLEPFWYWTMTVNFYRDQEDHVQQVRLPFQSGAHPVFVKGLDMSSAPPPPELCP